MFGHGADMARGTARSNHRRIAERCAAFQIDGDDVLGLVVVQRRQNAFQKIALNRRFARRRGDSGLLGGRLAGGFLDGLFDGFWCGLPGRNFFGGFRGFRLGGGLLRGFLSGFASQGSSPLRSGNKV
jgi:hypothetical protein